MSTAKPTKCEHEHCVADSVVGWANPPCWLCMHHFEAELAGTRTIMDAALKTWAESVVLEREEPQ